MSSLAEQFMPFAKEVARRYASRLPICDRDDIEANAYLGLVEAEASGKFDPAKGSFAQYAGPFVRGAIIDGLKFSLPDNHPALIDVLDEACDPAKLAEVKEEAQFVADHLPDKRYGRPTADLLLPKNLAKTRNISKSTASYHLNRARKILQHSHQNPCVN